MTTVTTNLGLTEPDYNSSSWNVPLNSNFSTLDAVAGNSNGATVTGLSSPQTLTLTQIQSLVINFSGVLTASFTYNFPSTVGGQWLVRNTCTGNFPFILGYNSSSVTIPSDGNYYFIAIDSASSTQTIAIVPTATAQTYSGNPNGSIAGVAGTATNPASIIWDSEENMLWICTATGNASNAVWSVVGGQTQFGVLTPSSISGRQDNYNPSGISASTALRLSSSAAASISGLTTNISAAVMGANNSGRYLIAENVGTYNITLLDQNSNSTAANRFLIGFNYVLAPGQSAAFWYDATTLAWRLVGSPYSAPFTPPGLRLTISSGQPVMTSDVAGAGTIYYTPYLNGYINLPNGKGAWYTAATSEISLALSGNTLPSTAYDVFVWNNAGTISLVISAWSTTTTRANNLVRDAVAGVYVNPVAITSGPAIGLGVYVGSFCTNASNQLDFVANPAATSGGGNARVGIWNYYNRVALEAKSADNNTWYSSSTSSWIPADIGVLSGLNNRVSVFCGLQLDRCRVNAMEPPLFGYNGTVFMTGIGVNSISANSGNSSFMQQTGNAGITGSNTSYYSSISGLGLNYYQLLEFRTPSAGVQINATGSGGGNDFQSNAYISYSGMY